MITSPSKLLLSPLRARTNVVVSVLDQGASSLTNFAVVVFAARSLTASEFGAFSVAYVVYTLVLALNQAYLGQVVVLERTDMHLAVRRTIERTLPIAAFEAVLIAAAGLVVGGAVGHAMVILAAVLVPLLLQDIGRFGASALRCPQSALLSDALWLVFVVVLLALPLSLGESTNSALIVWAAGGWLAIVPFLLGIVPTVLTHGGDGYDRRRARRLGTRFSSEFVISRGTNQVGVLWLAAVAGIAATGALRGLASLFGPVNVLIGSVATFAIPILRDRPPRRMLRESVACGVVLYLLAVGLGLVLWTSDDLGPGLLGATWVNAKDLVPAMSLQVAAVGLGGMAITVLRIRAPRTTLYIRIVIGATFIPMVMIGYVVDGMVGAVWAMAMSAHLQVCIAWATVWVLWSRTSERGGPLASTTCRS